MCELCIVQQCMVDSTDGRLALDADADAALSASSRDGLLKRIFEFSHAIQSGFLPLRKGAHPKLVPLCYTVGYTSLHTMALLGYRIVHDTTQQQSVLVRPLRAPTRPERPSHTILHVHSCAYDR